MATSSNMHFVESLDQADQQNGGLYQILILVEQPVSELIEALQLKLLTAVLRLYLNV